MSLFPDILQADEETDFTKDMLLGIKCDENPAHTAVFYCTVCSSNLCAHCSAITHTGRVLSKHNRVRLVDKPVPKTMCPYHSAYAIEFVCQVDIFARFSRSHF